ncbi:hypothetical protein [Clostridium thermarum]|uniref:hypothetical protein n=1 Tax=Clostridium thermarum TaxID=1716543 RepID=UPI0013D0CC08|nr:hypothetical protein [Clostridium thermarum]
MKELSTIVEKINFAGVGKEYEARTCLIKIKQGKQFEYLKSYLNKDEIKIFNN